MRVPSSGAPLTKALRTVCKRADERRRASRRLIIIGGDAAFCLPDGWALRTFPSSGDGLGIRWQRSSLRALKHLSRLALRRRATLELRTLDSWLWLA